MPLVSVITPTLNSEGYILETINSIRLQSYKKIEHIIVDGGSTDNTVNLIKRYPNIILFNTNKSGMYPAINIGLKNAKGDIFCYLNSDDLFNGDDTISRVVEVFMSSKEKLWVYGNCDFINSNGNFIKHSVAPILNFKLFSCLDGMSIFQPAVFWHRKIHEKYGYFCEEYRLASDFDFFIRICKYEKPIRIGGKSLAKFRVHPDALSSRYEETNKHEVKTIQKKNNARTSYPIRLLATLINKVFNIHKLF